VSSGSTARARLSNRVQHAQPKLVLRPLQSNPTWPITGLQFRQAQVLFNYLPNVEMNLARGANLLREMAQELHEAIFEFTGDDGTNHEPGTLRSPVLGTSTHAFAMVLQSTLPITL